MNKAQKEVQQAQLDDEKKVIKLLERVYEQAKKDCEQKIRELSARTDLENLQSIIYQKQYQEAIKKQLDGILEELHTNQFANIADYLQKSYSNGFIGTMYDLHSQGIPMIIPIQQEQVVKAVQTDSKLSSNLYTKLGEDTNYLKKSIRAELSRGISSGSTWNEMAVHIAKGMNSPFRKSYNNAIRIARTEGHRIQNEAALDGQHGAKKKGADIVKQWDATLDGRTRPEHREADGQIRELDEPFDIGGEKMQAPGVGGSARNVCNCRCCLSQRARWALDEDELKTLQERAEYFGLDKSKDFEDFKQKYFEAKKIIENDRCEGVRNKFGEDIAFHLGGMQPKKQEEIMKKIGNLSDEYNTSLKEVFYNPKLRNGGECGNVDSLYGYTMELGDPSIIEHEFFHTLTCSKRKKWKIQTGLDLETHDDFQKEANKLYKEYKKAAMRDSKVKISDYSLTDVDEFFAEAFSAAHGGSLADRWGSGGGSPYVDAAKNIVDKYFKKLFSKSGNDGTTILADINKMITPYERKVLNAIPEKEGYFDFAAHGAADHIEYGEKGKNMTAHEVAQIIKHHEKYNGQNVRLLSCNTGSTDDGFAQQLANALGVEVEAPTDLLIVYPDGIFKVGVTGEGTMRRFKPGKED